MPAVYWCVPADFCEVVVAAIAAAGIASSGGGGVTAIAFVVVPFRSVSVCSADLPLRLFLSKNCSRYMSVFFPLDGCMSVLVAL